PEADENLDKIKAYCEKEGFEVFPVSAAMGTGLTELIDKVSDILMDYPDTIKFEEDYEEYYEMPEENEAFTISVTDDNVYIVSGVGVEKMIGYTNIDTEKGFAFFQRYLREKGIVDALREKGIKEGDTVMIYNLLFDYYE
ncbi:MAG: Obg family GTPase CgtA, partial [Clostridiales bacterium]|nr:Obg family GTPase CgtA [Clostridiales bacterium]